jgi:hypothetical protein
VKYCPKCSREFDDGYEMCPLDGNALVEAVEANVEVPLYETIAAKNRPANPKTAGVAFYKEEAIPVSTVRRYAIIATACLAVAAVLVFIAWKSQKTGPVPPVNVAETASQEPAEPPQSEPQRIEESDYSEPPEGAPVETAGARYMKPEELEVVASSTLKGYQAQSLVDGDWTTSWSEGSPGDGVGEWVVVRFRDGVVRTFERVELVPGYDKVLPDKMGDRWPVNNRLKAATFQIGNVVVNHRFDTDSRTLQEVQGLQGARGSQLKITITECVKGTAKTTNDLCLSELSITARD